MRDETKKKPFKGLDYYEEKDEDIFFGRGGEAGELASLAELNRLTLVFGKSGIGKTSLLNAGLFPLLRGKNFLPVRIRLDYSTDGAPLLSQIKAGMAGQFSEYGITVIPKGGTGVGEVPAVGNPGFKEGESLWEYFRRVDFEMDFEAPDGSTSRVRVTPVLLLDQFEEFFTLGKHHPERDELMDELYWLIEDQVPRDLEKRILNREEVFPFLREYSTFRVVLGLREDYLPHMEELKQKIPSLHRVTYRLIHLNGLQAREVMDRAGVFPDDAIKRDILEQFYPGDMEPGKVIAETLEVEPALFSLLCDRVYEKGVGSLTKQAKDDILADFYRDIMDGVAQSDEIAVWIEDHLLTESGFRTPRYLERKFAMREGIEKAIDKKLLRKLYIGNKEHVEIIHDVLAPVIYRRKKQRMEELKLREMENELRRRRKIISIISIVAIISVIMAVYAIIQQKRANEQYKLAVSNRLAFEAELTSQKNNTKAIRIAEAAYKIGLPSPPASAVRALCASFYSSRERPYYRASLNHSDIVYTAVFTPDGSRIFTLSNEYERSAKLWNLEGKLLVEFKKDTGFLTNALVSPDGKRILTVSYNIVKLWNLEGKLLVEFKVQINKVITIALFSPDGSRVLTVLADGTAKLWDLSGARLAELKGHNNKITGAVFSHDGSRILTASVDGTAKLWNLKGALIAECKENSGIFICPAFSPDDSLILTASYHTAKLWNMKGKLLVELKGHTGHVKSVAFSPNGSNILTSSRDKTAKLWNKKGRLLAEFKGHQFSVTHAMFSHSGSQILTASDDSTVKVWDLKGNLLADLKGHKLVVTSAVFSPDDSCILTASGDGTVKLWDLTGKLPAGFKVHEFSVNRAVFSPESSQVLTASYDSTAKLLDLEGKLLTQFEGHLGEVFSVVFSPDGSRVLTASSDITARLWDIKGQSLVDFEGHTNIVTSAVFSSDGTRVLTASLDSTVMLWDMEGNCLNEFEGHNGGIASAVFSPDNSQILTASDQNTAKLWNMEGKLLAEFKGHTGYVTSAVYSPDGSRVLTSSWDKTAKIWNIEGKLLTEIKGHTRSVKSAVFSPDGSRVLTASNDNTAKLWHVEGKLLAELNGHTESVNSAMFSPDGKYIVTASDDGTIIIWPTPETILEWLKTDPIPKLTAEEKKELGIEEFDID